MTNKISIKSEKQIGKFYFDHAGSFEPMPTWSEFFVDLGIALASVQHASESLLVAVATPTRAFAANLIALGFVSARSNVGNQSYTLDEHFDRLSSLKPGTVVELLEKGKKTRCAFLGIETFAGEQVVKVKLKKVKKESLEFIPKRYCQRIILSDELMEMDRVMSRKLDIIPRPNFTKHFLDSVSPSDFALKQRLDCRIIGRQNILKLEARAEMFAVSNQEAWEVGNLNDVLRIKEIVRKGDPFRTEILSSNNGDHNGVENETPAITIYDGANYFLNFGSDSSRQIRVALLDRTEPRFLDATLAISDMFVNRRTTEVELKLKHYLPAGVEILAFMEAQR